MEKKEISRDYYDAVIDMIDQTNDKQSFMTIHKVLDGKTVRDNHYPIQDCGEAFITQLLTRDRGRCIVYRYTKGAKEFINSEYLSSYIKEKLKKQMPKSNLTMSVINLLNSNKNINEMNKEEISSIMVAIKRGNIRGNDHRIINCFSELLYKLDGEGATKYIKDYVSDLTLADHIIYTSGIHTDPDYYRGIGVEPDCLSDENLCAIFEKLCLIDPEYAINFVEMIKQLSELSPSSVITAFQKLAKNHFQVEEIKLPDEEDSIESEEMEEKRMRKVASESIKSSFIEKVRSLLIPLKIEMNNREKRYIKYHL